MTLWTGFAKRTSLASGLCGAWALPPLRWPAAALATVAGAMDLPTVPRRQRHPRGPRVGVILKCDGCAMSGEVRSTEGAGDMPALTGRPGAFAFAAQCCGETEGQFLRAVHRSLQRCAVMAGLAPIPAGLMARRLMIELGGVAPPLQSKNVGDQIKCRAKIRT